MHTWLDKRSACKVVLVSKASIISCEYSKTEMTGLQSWHTVALSWSWMALWMHTTSQEFAKLADPTRVIISTPLSWHQYNTKPFSDKTPLQININTWCLTTQNNAKSVCKSSLGNVGKQYSIVCMVYHQVTSDCRVFSETQSSGWEHLHNQPMKSRFDRLASPILMVPPLCHAVIEKWKTNAIKDWILPFSLPTLTMIPTPVKKLDSRFNVSSVLFLFRTPANSLQQEKDRILALYMSISLSFKATCASLGTKYTTLSTVKKEYNHINPANISKQYL